MKRAWMIAVAVLLLSAPGAVTTNETCGPSCTSIAASRTCRQSRNHLGPQISHVSFRHGAPGAQRLSSQAPPLQVVRRVRH